MVKKKTGSSTANRSYNRTPASTVNRSEQPTFPLGLEWSTRCPTDNIPSPTTVVEIHENPLLRDRGGQAVKKKTGSSTANRSDNRTPASTVNPFEQPNLPLGLEWSYQCPTDIPSPTTVVEIHENTLLRDGGGLLVKEERLTLTGSSMANCSIDRTPVSLGGNVVISQRKIMLDELWSPAKILIMVMRAKEDGVHPLRLEDIIEREFNPAYGLSKKEVATKLFFVILHLKKYNFLKLLKRRIKIGHIGYGDEWGFRGFGSWMLVQVLAFAPNVNGPKASGARIVRLLSRKPLIESDSRIIDDPA